MQIRQFLTAVLGEGGISEEFSGALRAIRGACLKYLEAVGRQTTGGQLWLAGTDFGGPYLSDLRFNQALGELRGVIGVQVGLIAVQYDLEVEDRLAATLPRGDS